MPYTWTILQGGDLTATPRLELPSGSIRLRLTGPDVADRPVTVFVLEGGGGFPLSQAALRTDGAGELSPPRFVLGPAAGANRLLVQSDHAHLVVTVLGSYEHTEIAAVDPPSGLQEGFCRRRVAFKVQVRDTLFPNAPIAGMPAYVELKSGGGGFLDFAGLLLRAWAGATAGDGSIVIGHLLSSREESTTVRVGLLEAPQVSVLELTARAYRPRLLSCGTAGRDEATDDVAARWLSKLVRVGTYEVRQDQLCGGALRQHIEVRAKKTAGNGDLFPAPESGWGGSSSLIVRPGQPGPFEFELRLPDFPDEPRRTFRGKAVARLAGPDVVETPLAGGANYVEKNFGGVFDPQHGVEIAQVENDVQLVGPKMSSPRKFQFRLLIHPLPNPLDTLKEVTVCFKVRTTPRNSAVDDPGNPDDVPGTISPTPGGGADVYEEKISPPVPKTLGVFFNANDLNLDHVVEVTARVKIRDNTGGTGADKEYDTTLLARAFFFRPRLEFTRKEPAGTFVPVDERAVVPTVVVREDGSPAPRDPEREVYLELRTPITDGRAELRARLAGGAVDHPLKLQRVSTTGAADYTLFRSKPIVCYLEPPDTFGVPQFTLPADREFVRVDSGGAPTMPGTPGYTLQGFTDDIERNTRPVTYWTPIRPVAHVNVDSVTGRLRAAVPRPRFELTGLATRSTVHAIVLSGGKPALSIEGAVRDYVADITRGGGADIREIAVNGKKVDVTPQSAVPLEFWPAPYRGTFTAVVELEPGLNMIELVATNVLGGTCRQLLEVELLDPRNDFAHPDPSVMTARVRVLPDPDRTAIPDLVRAHYWAPHETVGSTVTTLPGSVDVTVESFDALPGVTKLDGETVRLYRTLGKENSYASGPLLLVPDTLDPALLQKADQAGVPYLKHRPGSRLRVTGRLAHPAGSFELANWNASEQLSVRLLVQDAAGNFQPAARVRLGERFTVEAKVDDPRPRPNVLELRLGACDRLARLLPGDLRVLDILLEPHGTTGWLRMAGYLDPVRGGIRTSSVLALSRSESPPASGAALRLHGGGALQIGQTLGPPALWLCPVDHEPVRQVVGGAAAPRQSPRGTTAMAGARRTVVAATGEMTLSATDARLHGRGLDLAFIRTYQSFSDYDGPMGWNWSHGFDTRLRRLDRDSYRWLSQDGGVYDFQRSGTRLEPPPGIYGSLEEVGRSLCRLAWPGGSAEAFAAVGTEDPDLLLPVAAWDHARNRIEYVHDQTGLLAQVEDPPGQRLYLRYDPALRVAAVSDATGRRWTYDYHDGTLGGMLGDLKSVTTPAVTIGPKRFPDGKTWSFTYETPAPGAAKRHKLNGIIDPRGQPTSARPAGLGPVLAIEYDDQGRVKLQTYGKGPYGFEYQPARTTVTNRVNEKKRFEFDPAAPPHLATLPSAFVELDGPKEYTTGFHHNPQGEVDRVTTPMLGVTERTFDHADPDPRKRGDLRRITVSPLPGLHAAVIDTTGLNDFQTDPPSRTPARLEWEFDYDPRYQRVKRATDPLGRETVWSYRYEIGSRDDACLVRLEEPRVTFGHTGGTGAQERVTRWEYDNFGQPARKIDPNGVIEQYRYYAAERPNAGAVVDPLVTPASPTGWLARLISDAAPPDPVRSPSLVPPQAAEHKFSYDERGELETYVDPPDRTYSETHNELGQLVRREDPEGLVEEFHFDENDDLVKHTEEVADRLPAGARTLPDSTLEHEYKYDRLHNRTHAILDASGLVITHRWEFDNEDRLQFERSPSALLGTEPGDAERFTEYRYNVRGLLEWEIRAPNIAPQRSLHFEYDDDGRLIRTTDAAGLVSHQELDGWGRLSAEKDGLGNVQKRAYDAAGQLTRLTVSGSIAGGSATGVLEDAFLFLDAAGRQVASVEKAFRHDAQQQRVDIGSGRRVTQFEHDPGGNRNALISPRGHRTDCKFTGRGRLAQVDDHLTGASTFEYSLADDLKKMVLPAPRTAPPSPAIVLERTYDRARRLASSEQLGKDKTRYYYDTLGRLRLIEDPLGNRVYQVYDGIGRLVKLIREMRQNGRLRNQPGGPENPLDPNTPEITITYRYDDNSNLTGVLDSDRREAVKHVYGPREEKTKTVLRGFSGTDVYGYEYKPSGLLDKATLPDGFTIGHEYDAAARLETRTVTHAGGGTVPGTRRQAFKYDGVGRVVTAEDESDLATSTVRRRYDSLGNVWEDSQHEPVTARTRGITAEFKDTGELFRLEYPDGGPRLEYLFDPVGRLASVSDASAATAGGLAAYRYDGKYLDVRSYPNGLTLDLYHAADGRLFEHLHDEHGSRSDLVAGEQIYQRTAAGFPEVVLNLKTNTAQAFIYDSFYRNTVRYDGVRAAALADHPAPGQQGAWSTFDKRGNLTVRHTGTVESRPGASAKLRLSAVRQITRTPNDANQIVSSVELVTPASAADNFLLAGKVLLWGFTFGSYQLFPPQTYEYDGRGNLTRDATRRYEYDVFNRLISVTEGSRVTTFAYDALGRRLLKSGIRFTHHGDLLVDEEAPAGGARKRYLYGGEALLALDLERPGSAPHRYYAHEDRTGGVLFLSDRNNNVVEQYGYDPHGTPEVYDNQAQRIDLGQSVGNRFFSQGQYYDEETGLYSAGARTYHPELQRMLQRDTEFLDEDTNLYSYARSNLQAFRDPSGHTPVVIPLMAIGFVAGVAFGAAHQIARKIDDPAEQFSVSELLWSGLAGAVTAPMLFVAPQLGFLAMTGGVIHAGFELSAGHPVTAGFELATALLPLRARVVREAMLGRGFPYMRGLRRNSTLLERARFILRPQGSPQTHRIVNPPSERYLRQFGPDRAVILERWRKVEWVLRERARQLAIDPDRVRLVRRHDFHQRGIGAMLHDPRTGQIIVSFEELRQLPQLRRAARAGLIQLLSEAEAYRYPRIGVNFAHEASHALFGAGHGGPTDASRLAHSVFYEARGWISRPTADLLSRSYY